MSTTETHDQLLARCANAPLRYFMDERVGCVAVRDREHTDPDYQGLHSDTEGVVQFWIGRCKAERCPTCGSLAAGQWLLAAEDLEAARALCAKLNAEAAAE